MNEWLTTEREPPQSNYGSVAAGTLVWSSRAATGFPDVPGVTYTGLYNSVRVTDYSVHPPSEGEEYGVLVPKVDSDGNSLAVIRVPAVSVPIATYTGWNLSAAGYAEDEMCGARGSFIPFAASREERVVTGDPRPSVQERYLSRSDYVARVARAAEKLVTQRFLLPEDADLLIEEAREVALPFD